VAQVQRAGQQTAEHPRCRQSEGQRVKGRISLPYRERKTQQSGADGECDRNDDPTAQERGIGLPVVSFHLVDQHRTDDASRSLDHPPHWAVVRDFAWAAARCRNASRTASS
jgi:hypothetical protein